MKNIPTLYYTIINLLAENERCRNDDRYLICKVWVQMYPSRIMAVEVGGEQMQMVSLRSIANDFEAGDSITRIRRKLQNDLGLYPPTIWSVARGRRIKEEQWRENCRNNFNKEQSKAIMEIYLRAKDASKRNLVDIKNQIKIKYNI